MSRAGSRRLPAERAGGQADVVEPGVGGPVEGHHVVAHVEMAVASIHSGRTTSRCSSKGAEVFTRLVSDARGSRSTPGGRVAARYLYAVFRFPEG